MLLTGQHFRMHLGNSMQNWAIPQNNTSTNGEAFNLLKMQTILTHMSPGLVNVLQCFAILELMKDTLPSRLCLILFPIDNLRDAITTAKWVLIKKRIGRQKTGQSPATPFMQMNECSQATDRSSKRGMTCDMMET